MSESVSVIITAGGLGKRMRSKLPKQFISINDTPIFVLTIQRFIQFLPKAQIVLVMHKDHIDLAESILNEFNLSSKVLLIEGGLERFHSIKNGLNKVNGGWVMTHDAVRPFFSRNIIEQALGQLKKYQAIIPVLPVRETLREVSGETSKTVERSRYKLVQTPQCFHTGILKKGYEVDYESRFTDDASVVEKMDVNIKMIDGNSENIKVTEPEDLEWASFFYQKMKVNNEEY